jgi:hypothetical protein
MPAADDPAGRHNHSPYRDFPRGKGGFRLRQRLVHEKLIGIRIKQIDFPGVFHGKGKDANARVFGQLKIAFPGDYP